MEAELLLLLMLDVPSSTFVLFSMILMFHNKTPLLYLRTIEGLSLWQTPNTQQPTCNTHHLDIKHFVLLDWVQCDLLALHTISTHDNGPNTFTKPLGKQLFHWHCDTIMGHLFLVMLMLLHCNMIKSSAMILQLFQMFHHQIMGGVT